MQQVDRRYPVPVAFQPYEALVWTFVCALNFGNLRGGRRVFANCQQMATKIIDRRDPAEVGAAQEKVSAKAQPRARVETPSPTLDLWMNQVLEMDRNHSAFFKRESLQTRGVFS